MATETEEVEVELVSVREEQIKEIIGQYMRGERHLSFSSLKAFAESPAEFIQYILREKKTTPAMQWGVLVHCMILEPDTFDDRYTIMDDLEICTQIGGKSPRSTNKYKDWKAEFLSTAGDSEIIPITMFNQAAIVVNNVNSNRAARSILDMCPVREGLVEWKYCDMKFRGFIDAKSAPDGEKAKLDIKTCKDASPRKFHKEIIENKYHLQAAMYTEAEMEYSPYHIIAVDKKSGVSVHRLEPPLIEHGAKEYKRLMDGFNRCLLTDTFGQSYDFWADSKSGIYTAKLPAYLQ